MINLSKSRYCTGLQCPKILWLDIHKSEEKDNALVNQTRFDTGSMVGELARDYFDSHALVAYSEDKSVMLAETERLVAAETPVICEASFACESGFCSVDILRYYDGGFEIVEVKSSTGLKPEHLDDMAFQYHILVSSGLPIRKVSLLHINNHYERLGALDIQKLFTLKDCTNEVKEKQDELVSNIARIKEIAGAGVEPDIRPGKQCDRPYTCLYKDYCLRSMAQEAAQIADTEKKLPLIDRDKIKTFLDTLSYPLYYLDFETFQEAVPSYDRQKPYQQIPCQYSLHIQARPGAAPEHREFLAQPGCDPRRSVAERLCADIPGNVTVLAYSMSFEKGCLEKLADIFADLASQLTAINDNIKDLMVPFKTKAWRSPLQEGSNSLKAVVPAMFPGDPELDYSKLGVVKSGGEAMNAFPDLLNQSPQEQERTRAALLAYCRLDTLVMVRIVEQLRKSSEE
jgi:hypothetical protein